MSKHDDECRVPKLHVGRCDGYTAVAAERRRIIREVVRPPRFWRRPGTSGTPTPTLLRLWQAQRSGRPRVTTPPAVATCIGGGMTTCGGRVG